MSKELIGKIRDELSDGGVMVAPYWAELFKESAEALETQAREIERLNSDYNEACEDAMCVARELERRKMNCLNLLQQLEDLKSQPSGVVQWPDADEIMQMAFEEGQPGDDASGYYFELEEFDLFLQRLMEEVARLNSSPASAGDERALYEQSCKERAASNGRGYEAHYFKRQAGVGEYLNPGAEHGWQVWQQARADLSANHSEQARHMVPAGWQLVPVEPTDAMLEAGDKYIGTPATYKAMLSACPSPDITKDFSQFLSAVMDAAGLIRHGRQSKELSEYLGMKCMEYRGVAPSPGSQEQGE